jgi:hypothetical protein
MSVFDRLFGKDLTADWPSAGKAPTLDLERARVGPLRLGDPVESAKVLGKPDRFGGAQGAGAVLEYAGYDLEFSDGRLVCAKFDVDGPRKVAVGDVELSRSTQPLDVHAWFGEPSSDSTDGKNLRWIDYEREAATLALEFSGGRLSCVQLYAPGYA